MYIQKSDDRIILNKYSKLYFSIIEKAQKSNRKKSVNDYYENHHILPKCLFPEFSSLKSNKWNGVLLTPKEHFICHWLLTKMFKDTFSKQKMQRALNGLNQKTNHSKLTAKQYEICRMSVTNKPGRQWTEEEKLNHSVLMKQIMANSVVREKVSKSKRGKPGHKHTEESKAKLSLAQRNITTEQRKNKSESKKGEKNGMYGKKWFHKETKTRAFYPGSQPEGWKEGRYLPS